MANINNEPYKVDGAIKNFVVKMAKSGLSTNKIYDAAQAKGYQNMPLSRQTFYKYYRKFVDEVRGDAVKEVANKLYERALNEGEYGHFPSQELILTTQAGWSKTQINLDVEVDAEEDNSAKAALLEKLGITLDDEETDN